MFRMEKLWNKALQGVYGQHDLFIHLEDSQRMCGRCIPLCFKAQWNDLVVGTSGCLELSKQWSECVSEDQDIRNICMVSLAISCFTGNLENPLSELI